MSLQPIFIFSISRSGSTLLQRVMAAHDGVATVSEPWLLLPHAYTLRPRGVDAEYLHFRMVEAIEDFCGELPGGRSDYEQEMHDFAMRLYAKAAGDGAIRFVDKSPPYSLVAREIMQVFPEGRFVFLWRNPLGIVASMIETWEPWSPTFFRDDLFVGLPRLISAYTEAKDASVYSVRFEDLVHGEASTWAPLMRHVGIEFDPATLGSFADVGLRGRMGDPTGVHAYGGISREPQAKWKRTLANPLRKAWCLRYLRFLGGERLAAIGYDIAQLEREIRAQPLSFDCLLPDLGRLVKDVAKEPVRVRTRYRRVGGPNVIRALIHAGGGES